jgi:YggT family protein
MINALILIINLYMLAIVIRAVYSWASRPASSGFIRFIDTFTDPVLIPLRRALPPIAGRVDISPLIVLIIAQILKRFLISCV